MASGFFLGYMKYLILSISLFCMFSSKAYIVTVKQDGTGDFTTIQDAINSCSFTSYDTILVWPGIYFENIYNNGKPVTIASRYILTPDKWYIHNTVIDGSLGENCVRLFYGDETLQINGFTIRNGAGRGIYIQYAQVKINNCIIENNHNGGVSGSHSFVYLSNTTIRYNSAETFAGAIGYGSEFETEFDPVNKCSIYLNFAAKGCEIAKNWMTPSQTIIVDTFTVMNPDYHFIFSFDTYNNPVNDISIQIDHAYLEPVDHDLYVNPETGSNANSGLSPAEPLKTLAYANSLIKPDSLNPHSIFLANGIYSRLTNEEVLPLGSRSFISFVGENRDSTIIDGGLQTRFFEGYAKMHDFTIQNITFQRGFGGMYIDKNDRVKIKNVVLKDGGYESIAGFVIGKCDEFVIEKIVIKNLVGNSGLELGNFNNTIRSFSITGCLIYNILPDENAPYSILTGGGPAIYGNFTGPFSYLGHVSNMQVTNNINIPDPLSGSGLGSGLKVFQYCKVDLVNATIGHNILRGSSGVGTHVYDGAELNIYNSILYGDSLRELSLGHSTILDNPSTCRVYYSDVEGGQGAVYNWNNINTLVWGTGNIDSNPLWDTTASVPYAIPWDSPCVNTGTPMYDPGMLPPYIIEEDSAYKLITFDYDTIALPTTDLAGNPRITNGRIDMGAYEFPDTTVNIQHQKMPEPVKIVNVFPNPFYENAFISLTISEPGNIRLAIYDIRGILIRELMDTRMSPGSCSITWDGKDDFGDVVALGEYIIKVRFNGKELPGTKVVKGKWKW